MNDIARKPCAYCKGTGKIEENDPVSQGERIVDCPKCSGIARKAAQVAEEIYTRQVLVGEAKRLIQAAMEKATAYYKDALERAQWALNDHDKQLVRLSRKCFDLTEEIAELRSQFDVASDDTKRLEAMIKYQWQVCSHKKGWEVWDRDENLVAESITGPREAINAAMKREGG